jgi:hypothetical protein
MDRPRSARHASRMGTLPHIKRLDDAFGMFLVRIVCKCGAERTTKPEPLARLCGASATLESVGPRMRCSQCGTKGATVTAVSIPRPRGRGFR